MVKWTANLASRVLEVSTAALVAIDHGRSPYLEVCARSAALVGATSAAYVHVDLRSGESRAACWAEGDPPPPDGDAAHRLSPVADASSHGGVTVPLAAGPRHLRFLGLAKPSPFRRSDRDLLVLLRDPLLALDEHLRTLEDAPLSVALTHAAPAERDPRCGITGREAEVLGLLAEGLTAQAIARSLDLSPRTVHKHLGSLYTKLGTHDRLSAVTRGQQLGILPPAVGIRRLGG